MKKSVKWSRFFESVIYFILLVLPLISVFARVIYTQSNNHSYMSYSDTSAMRTIAIDSNNTSLIVNGKQYFVNGITGNSFDGSLPQNYIMYSECSYDWQQRFNLSFVPSGVAFYKVATSSFIIAFSFYDDLTSSWDSTAQNRVMTYEELMSLSFEFTLTGWGYNASYGDGQFYKVFNVSIYANLLGKLDNAFDYGLQKTIDDFGTGNINFLNWFGTMFFNDPSNLLYINFVNMYLNYALWVSVGYLIYYFLIFFVKIIRNLVDSFIKKGESW